MTKKIFGGYLVIILLVAVIGGYAMLNFHRLHKITQSMLEVDFPMIDSGRRLLAVFFNQVSDEKRFMALRKQDFISSFDKRNEEFKGILHTEYSILFRKIAKAVLVSEKSPTLEKEEKRTEVLVDKIISKIQEMIKNSQTTLSKKVIRSQELENRAKTTATLILTGVLQLLLV